MENIIDATVESLIIRLLKDGPLSTLEIIEMLQKYRSYTPKQTAYQALRKLKKKEIVAISGKTVSLNQVWIAKMKNFFTEVDLHYTNAKRASLFSLQEKEYIFYRFDSLLSLDIFWGHAFMLFMRATTAEMPILIYSPHDWPLIIRKEDEMLIMEEVRKKKAFWMHLVAGRKTLDYEMKKYFDGKHTVCHLLDEQIFPANYYLNCFNDFIIEVWIDKRSEQDIERIYNSSSAINDKTIKDLEKIYESKNHKHKMKISKNSVKIMKAKKLFNKYFIIP